MPKAFSEKQKERIRARLLEAGKGALNRGGLKAVVIDDIAGEAGISKGSFYAFFPSREDFILSVFEAWETEYRGALIRMVSEGKDSPREKLERFFKGAFSIFEREPGLAKIRFTDVGLLVEALPPERLSAHQANDQTVLERTFSQWAEDGLLDPSTLAALPGIGSALFCIAMHKEDFPEGSFGPACDLVAEALAMRIAAKDTGKGDAI